MGCEQEELGLEGTEEEAAQIAKMQAAHRGKQDRKKVAELKGKKIEVRTHTTTHAGNTRSSLFAQTFQQQQQHPLFKKRAHLKWFVVATGGARAGGYGGGGGTDRQDAGGAQREEGPPEGR